MLYKGLMLMHTNLVSANVLKNNNKNPILFVFYIIMIGCLNF